MESKRYSRHELVEQIGNRAQDMRKKTVTVLGLGAVGTVVAEMLVRSGINIRIIDKGRILEEDLQRNFLFLEEDINKFKAKQAKKRLEAINPTVAVKAFHEDLTPSTIYLVESDLVIDCSNDLEVSLNVDKYCFKKKIPLIYSYVSGTKGQVFIVDKDVALSQVSEYVENHRISEKGIMQSTIHMAAAIISSKAAKLLLNAPDKNKDKNLISFDVWNFSFDMAQLKKGKK